MALDREDNEFLEFIDIVEEDELNRRAPKRYIRDAHNPLEFFEDHEFRSRYRFNKNIVIHVLLPLVTDQLSKINKRGLPIPCHFQLLVCLRYYATGNFQTVCGDLRGISQQSVSLIVKTVSELIAGHLRDFVKFPNTENDQRRNITKFWNTAHFPGVAACVDCTHIPIASPGGDYAEVFRNRKGFFSLNVQIAAGPSMEIMDIVVRHPGSTHDSVIFDRSALRIYFEQGQVRGLLLGDNGYPCRPYLLTPVIQPVNVHERRYNGAHIRTRNIVKRVNGVWKRRFPVLYRKISTKLETSVAVICVTATLYNIGLAYDNYINEENVINNRDEVDYNHQNNDQLGLLFRRDFINQHF